MSDFDNLLAGLEDAPATEEKAHSEAKKPRKRSTKATPAKSGRATTSGRGAAPAKSEQRGPRADPTYTQVNANIPRELHASLFFYLKRDGRTLSNLIQELLEDYVEEQGGIIGKKRGTR